MPLKPRDVIDASDPRVSQIGHPAPPWLVNYADLMTELVCFFVILYALSAALDPNAQKVQKAVDDKMKDTPGQEAPVNTKMTKDGLEITLKETGGNALFASGSADLTDHAKEVLDKIIPILMEVPNDVIVEGHTDNDPISTPQFASNWELSSARATNVVKYLIQQKNIPPSRLAAIGYGEYRPISDNSTPEGKSKNRRVVFLMKTTSSQQDKKTETSEPASSRTSEQALEQTSGRIPSLPLGQVPSQTSKQTLEQAPEKQKGE